MVKQTLKYIIFCMAIYLSISAIEIFLLPPLIDFISTDFWIHMYVYIFLLLVLNPIIIKLISDRFFKFEDVESINIKMTK